MSSSAKIIVKNTGFLYAKMGITMFVSLYTTRLVLNALGASDFGIYNIVGGAIAMLGFVNTSMASATQRFMSYAEGEQNQEKQLYIFNVSILLHFLIGLIAIVALTIVGLFFFNGILNIPPGREFAAKIVYASLVVSTAFSMMSVPYEAALNAHENMRYFAFVGILESILKLIVAYVCVFALLDKLIIYGILMALIPIILLIVMRVYCHKYYEECVLAPHRYCSKQIAKDMMSFAGWKFLGCTTSLLTMQGMAVLLNMFGGVIVNTAHGIANQLAGQLMVFSTNMLKALTPALVKNQGAGDTGKMLTLALTGSKFSFCLYAVFAIPFIIETPYILQLWLKQVPDWTVLFVRLVLLRQVFSQMNATLDTCIGATGYIRNASIVSSIIWISPLILGYLLYKLGFPIYTIYILLILMVLAHIVRTVYFCNKLCHLDTKIYFLEVFLPCCLVSLLTLGLLWTIHLSFQDSFLKLLFISFFGFVFFVFISYFIILNKNEKLLLIEGFRVIKQKLMVSFK